MATLISRFKIRRVSWRDLALTLGPFALLVVLAFWLAFHFVRPAPPDTIVITSGADGSMYQVSAERYRKILARQGVTLKILPSQGSLENLKRLSDANSGLEDRAGALWLAHQGANLPALRGVDGAGARGLRANDAGAACGVARAPRRDRKAGDYGQIAGGRLPTRSTCCASTSTSCAIASCKPEAAPPGSQMVISGGQPSAVSATGIRSCRKTSWRSRSNPDGKLASGSSIQETMSFQTTMRCRSLRSMW